MTQPKNEPRGPGLECPECDYLIAVSIPMLLNGRIICSQCGTVFHVEQETSGDTLAVLGKLWNGIEEAEKHQKAAMPDKN